MWGKTRMKVGARELLFKEGVEVDTKDIEEVIFNQEFFPTRKDVTFVKMKNGVLYIITQWDMDNWNKPTKIHIDETVWRDADDTKLRKHYSGAVIAVRGTTKEVVRTVYTDANRYFIKLWGDIVEVVNQYPNVTAGWKTVDIYDI